MFETIDEKLAAIDQTAPFFYHFGEFVWQFAVVEKFAHWVFDQHCGLDTEVARQLVGGEQLSKVTRMLSVVVRCSKTISDAQKAEMQDTITQIHTISTLRHALIHRGAEAPAAAELRVSNISTARTRESVEVLRLKLQDIRDATTDLRKITFRLMLFNAFGQVKKLRDGLSADVLAALDAPWRYKEIQPDKPFKHARKE